MSSGRSLIMLNKYLPPVDIIEGGFNVIKKNLHMVDISITTYLPNLVNAVKERPFELKENLASCLGQQKIIKVKLSIFYCMIFSLYHIEWKSNH